MRSIPTAMIWEIFARGYWGLLAATLGAIGFPALIFFALASDGTLSPRDQSMVVLQIVIMHFNVLTFTSAILVAQGRLSLLFAYPIPNSAIVAWRMLPAMAIVFAQTALSVALLNVLFELHWPIWGPACFVAVAFAAVQAALWLTEKALLWSIVALAFVATVLGFWFKSRFEEVLFGEPTRPWRQITPMEVATMLAITGVAYWVAVVAVARNRRGEPPLSLGIVEWLCRYFDIPASKSVWRDSPIRAQFWSEWRRKGWVMPTAALFILSFGLVAWLLFSRNPHDLFFSLVSGGTMLWIISFVGGLMLGNLGHRDGDSRISQFLATRPLTDTQLARVTTGTTALSTLLTWLIWVGAVLIGGAILWAAGAGDAIELPPGFAWWSFPGMLIGTWIVAGVLTTLGLTGSDRAFRLAAGLVMSFIALAVLPKFLLSPESQLLLVRAVVVLFAGLIIFGTVWIFAVALRRTLIQAPTVLQAAGLWAAAVALVVFQWTPDAQPRWFGNMLAAAVFALAVAPLAAAPLALSMNRHR